MKLGREVVKERLIIMDCGPWHLVVPSQVPWLRHPLQKAALWDFHLPGLQQRVMQPGERKIGMVEESLWGI